MPDSLCENCQKEFFYDIDLGLNIARFEGESNRIGFRAGGDFPCCPICEKRCAFEKKTFTNVDIKYSRRMILKRG